MSELFVPLIAPDADILSAAFEYTKYKWYVGPIDPKDRKNPGRVLGKKWPAKTSRDPEQLVEWFTATPWLLFLHVGRSGAWVPDVDHPDKIHEILAEAIRQQQPPYQSSRPDQPGRGHHVFLQPPDRMIGNGLGALGKGEKWGEGRGKNGIIVVAPSPHKDEADGARYEWLQTGHVPEMTPELAAALPDAGDTADAATDAQIERFISAHTEELRSAWLKGVLGRFEGDLTEGKARHDTMRDACCWAARESLIGLYPAKVAFDELTARFVTAMAQRRKPKDRVLSATSARAEAAGCIAWGIAQAELDGADELWQQARYRELAEELRREREPFWEMRPELTTIRDAARERMVSPWALLGATLAHVAASTGPHVVLPPLVGSYGSLNMFIGLVGPSGIGKDSALALSRELLNPDGFHVGVPTHEVGTGQGMAAAFVTENKQTGGLPVQCSDAALFTITEIDDLAAHAAMGGANIIPTLRKIYSGSDLGNMYADKTKRRPVRAHRYRCALVAGIQPARSRVLLADADGGLPQRWIWLPTNDPDHAPPEGEFITFMAAQTLWKPATDYAPVGEVEVPPSVHRKDQIVLAVCDTARDAVLSARRKRVTAPLTGSADGTDLDGHSLFTRLKLAAVLGILSRSDGKVTEDDWLLAGRVMAVSDATRQVCLDALGQVRRRENQGRGRDEAERQDARESETVKRVARAVLRKLGDGAWVRGSELRRGVSGVARPYFDPAVERLLAAGQVEREEITGQGRPGTQYRKVEGA